MAPRKKYRKKKNPQSFIEPPVAQPFESPRLKKYKKGGRKRGQKKKGPVGQIIKGIWQSLPTGIKAGVIGSGAAMLYSGIRKRVKNCTVTNTGRRRCKKRKIKLLDFKKGGVNKKKCCP